MAEHDLELLLLWPLPPECWNYRCAPPLSLCVVLGMELGASYMLGKHPSNKSKHHSPLRPFSAPHHTALDPRDHYDISFSSPDLLQ